MEQHDFESFDHYIEFTENANPGYTGPTTPAITISCDHLFWFDEYGNDRESGPTDPPSDDDPT